MGFLEGKKIVLIVTGSIAAYKSAFLTRLLVKEGAAVQVIMTPAAVSFITPLTLSTLSGRPALIEMMDEGSWNSHVDLGLWADLVLVAPATAHSLAKMALGLADNLAMTTYLSAKSPVMIAPAMDLDMWKHPATQHNVELLRAYGKFMIPVGDGELASGLSGEGRMAEPEVILSHVIKALSRQEGPLSGKKVLITAGPTYEPIDPVRFIGNHSSGKMGLALAENALAMGADVTLVLGPSNLQPATGIEIFRVRSADEMAKVCFDKADDFDILILAAAVADFKPVHPSAKKIKKSGDSLMIELSPTIDIAMELGRRKKTGQKLVGFALETENGLQNAQAKLIRKNFDFIVLNSLEDPGAGFQHDTNKITLVFPGNKSREFELKSKEEVARDILQALISGPN